MFSGSGYSSSTEPRMLTRFDLDWMEHVAMWTVSLNNQGVPKAGSECQELA